jgi:hypothetical protein
MTLKEQSPEALATPRALQGDRSCDLVNFVNGAKSTDHQYRLIATVPKSSGREEYRVALKNYSDGSTKAEVRIFERKHDVWSQTPRHIVIGRGAIAAVIAALCEAEQRL